MKDTYCLAHGLGQLTYDVKSYVKTLNFRSDVIFSPPRKHRMTFGKGRYATKNVKNERNDECYIIILMSYVKVRKITKHRSPMQTEKSQPSGQLIIPEIR